MRIEVCVFDAYGTLFDVSAAARNLAERPGKEALAEVWPTLADIWRRKQLEYSWLRAAAGVHADFWSVTADALDYAMEMVGGLGPQDRADLLDLYRSIDAYPEVPEVLRRLRDAGLATAILTNGSPAMIGDAVRAAGIGDLLDATLTVESVGVFKPAPEVYGLVGRRFGVPAGSVLFASSNGWDAAAATGFGFRTIWVNRRGEPIERLPWRPDAVAGDLTAVPQAAGAA